jgi:hypothetical protein
MGFHFGASAFPVGCEVGERDLIDIASSAQNHEK